MQNMSVLIVNISIFNMFMIMVLSHMAGRRTGHHRTTYLLVFVNVRFMLLSSKYALFLVIFFTSVRNSLIDFRRQNLTSVDVRF